MPDDPNDPLAAFTAYAADRLWVASHLTQLAGFMLLMAELVLLLRELETRNLGGCARIGIAGAWRALEFCRRALICGQD